MDIFKLAVIAIIMFFIIIISIQYTLNKILVTMRELKAIMSLKSEKRE